MKYDEEYVKKYLEGTNDGPTLEGDEFLEMMAERGLILPRPPTLGERLLHTAGAPWRGLKRAFTWITWRIWGKYLFEREVKKQVKRMKRLAGVEPQERDIYSTMIRPQRAGYLARPTPFDHSAARQVHDHVIKTKIVKEVLPKPDSDDSGLN